MKAFLSEDFLLDTKTAKRLYECYAAPLPIADYHSHLSAREIWENKAFSDVGTLWLSADHYKWRLMRAFGVREADVTGEGTYFDKFCAYARCLQFAAGNPLYHWSHLELMRYFGIQKVLTGESAPHIYAEANRVMEKGGFSPRELLLRSGVTHLGTTDDPADDLSYHKKLQADGFGVEIYPSFRTDKVLAVDAPDYEVYIRRLSEVSGVPIATYEDLKQALSRRMDAFDAAGCRTADQGILRLPVKSEENVEMVFIKSLNSNIPSASGAESFKTDLFMWLSGEFKKRGWVMQVHMGALRNVNIEMHRALGADCGIDTMDDRPVALRLSAILGALGEAGALPKTVLYSLNPKDNETLCAMMGCFQGEGFGKLQLGAAWWLNDHKDGIEAHLRTLASGGALATFVGMLTDSRSYVSFSRHEYFRRILCNLLGAWVEQGMFDNDEAVLRALISGICYENTCRYFNFKTERRPCNETSLSH